MSFHWIDWTIVVAVMVFITALAVRTNKYNKSVADFLAANRCAGRYILSVADGVAGLGAITVMAMWQMYYEAGFTPIWWTMMLLPIATIIAVSGYVTYRFRQTKAMTLSQFFEIRYSRKFRVFAGILCFTAGIVNFGIFPAIGTNFFILFCGLPETFSIFGFEVSTFVSIMILLLSTAILFTCIGGQIAVMITDFAQGIIINITFLLIIVFVFCVIDWSQISETLVQAPEDASMINPFHGTKIKNFNMWYFMIGIVGMFYGYMSWQGNQGYNCSAKSAHEAKMSKILGVWRSMGQALFFLVVPIVAYAIMRLTEYGELSAGTEQVLATIENQSVRSQMTVPLIMSKFLPLGLRGGLCAAMLAAFISTHDTYLHSWGSIFIQDVVMPFRKKPLDAKKHMMLLRVSILAVAVFIFLFSLVFRQTQAILMFMVLTGALFTGGAGAAFIGGLYWKRGTTAGAWTAMIVGATLAVAGFVLEQVWCSLYDTSFPINGQYMFAIAMFCSAVTYIGVSLLNRAAPFNLDRMLHRGAYAGSATSTAVPNDMTDRQEKGWFGNVLGKLGLTHEFTLCDKIIFGASILWNLGWFAVFVVGTVYNKFYDVSDQSWLAFWRVYVFIIFALSLLTTIWFLFGGLRDVKEMFAKLRSFVRDDRDDGTVIDHHNLNED